MPLGITTPTGITPRQTGTSNTQAGAGLIKQYSGQRTQDSSNGTGWSGGSTPGTNNQAPPPDWKITPQPYGYDANGNPVTKYAANGPYGSQLFSSWDEAIAYARQNQTNPSGYADQAAANGYPTQWIGGTNGPSSPTVDLLNQYKSWQDAQANMLNTDKNAQLGYQGGVNNLNQDSAYQDYLSNWNQLNTQWSVNQTQQNSNAIDVNNANQQLGFLGQNYQNDIGYNTQQQGNVENQYNNDIAHNNQQRDFTNAGFLLDQQAAAQQKDQSGRSALSDATARGDVGGLGYNQSQNDIAEQYNIATGRNELNKNLQIAGLDFSKNNSTIQHNSAAQGLVHDRNSTDIGHQSDVVNANANIAKLGQQGQALKLMADQYGMSQDDAYKKYQEQMTRMGLNYGETIRQIQQMYDSGNAQLQQQALNFQTQLLQAAALGG